MAQQSRTYMAENSSFQARSERTQAGQDRRRLEEAEEGEEEDANDSVPFMAEYICLRRVVLWKGPASDTRVGALLPGEVAVALDVSVILTPSCMIVPPVRFSTPNIQGCVRMTVTSTPRSWR